MIFVPTKNGSIIKNFPPWLLVLLLDPGSGMDKIQDPGSATLVKRYTQKTFRDQNFITPIRSPLPGIP